jgi:EAL domain-containing protein (putative c-di-GMP-specific phosphodiesterase class I)
MSPTVLIAMAERSGLINDIDEWVLRRACDDRRTWLAEFPGTDLDLHVNVSVRHLRHPSFVTNITDTLATSATPPTALVLEVTEAIFIDDIERVGDVLHAFEDSGIRIALDDYGTGPFARLPRAPADRHRQDRPMLRRRSRRGRRENHR